MSKHSFAIFKVHISAACYIQCGGHCLQQSRYSRCCLRAVRFWRHMHAVHARAQPEITRGHLRRRTRQGPAPLAPSVTAFVQKKRTCGRSMWERRSTGEAQEGDAQRRDKTGEHNSTQQVSQSEQKLQTCSLFQQNLPRLQSPNHPALNNEPRTIPLNLHVLTPNP